jgi:thioredoxin reductase
VKSPPIISSSSFSKSSQRRLGLSSLRSLQQTNENNAVKNHQTKSFNKDNNDIFVDVDTTTHEKNSQNEATPFQSQAKSSDDFALDEENTTIYPNIFVCGDVASTKTEKYAQYAELEAEVVVHNILQMENNRTRHPKLRPWTSPIHR